MNFKWANNKIADSLHGYANGYNAQDLSWFRIIFFTFLLSTFPNYLNVLSNDMSLFVPPFLGATWWTGRLPNYWIFTAGITILYLSTITLIWGRFKILSSILFLLTYTFCTSVYFSFGKVDHAGVLYPVIVFLFILTRFGSKKDAYLTLPSFYFLVAFSIGVAFLTAGIPKLLTGWLSHDHQAVYLTVIKYHFGYNRGLLGGHVLAQSDSVLLWEALDWLAVLFECSLIVFIFRPRLFLYGLVGCFFFHQFNFWVLGISFAGMMVVYLLFIPWSKVSLALRYFTIATISGLAIYRLGRFFIDDLIHQKVVSFYVMSIVMIWGILEAFIYLKYKKSYAVD